MQTSATPAPAPPRRLQAVPPPPPEPIVSEAPKKTPRLSTNAKRAALRLRSAVRILSRFDWERLEISGMRAAVVLLENAAAKLTSAPPQQRATAKVRPGDVVQINAKHPNAKRFDALLSETEREAFSTGKAKVVDIRKATAIVEVQGSGRMFIPIRELVLVNGEG